VHVQVRSKFIYIYSLHSPVVDLGNIWSNKSESSFWSTDFVHFSEKGYDAFGQIVADTLKGWRYADRKPLLSSKLTPKDVATSILSALRTKSFTLPSIC